MGNPKWMINNYMTRYKWYRFGVTMDKLDLYPPRCHWHSRLQKFFEQLAVTYKPVSNIDIERSR